MTTLIQRIYYRIRSEIIYAYLAVKTRYTYNREAATGEMTQQPHRDFCEITVVAFNNPQVIYYQILLLKKYFSFTYRYTVFDNSTSQTSSDTIKSLCAEHNVGYVKLPQQHFIPHGYGSYSHGIAINYLYNNYVKKSNAIYWGMLDHDIFPIRTFDIQEHLKRMPYYGIRHRRYIWPGFFFARMDYLKGKTLDFRPSIHLRGDTGIRNIALFPDIMSHIADLVHETHVKLSDEGDVLGNGYSVLDCGWMHCSNASNYANKDSLEYKMSQIYAMLEAKLKQQQDKDSTP